MAHRALFISLILFSGAGLAEHHEDAALAAALAGDQRESGTAARDQYRHPGETLAFFGIKADMKVIEIRPGGSAWYTQILAPYLRDSGELTVAVAGLDAAIGYQVKGTQRQFERFKNNPGVYGKVKHVVFQPAKDKTKLGESNSVDMVLTFRNAHNWHRRGYLPGILASMFDVLKPGGILGVVQHRAAAGTNPDETAPRGYLSQAAVVEMVTKAGFELEDASEVNANPKDLRDYPEGVWTLPPRLRLGDQDRDKYLAIGESDRMTLRFVKPGS
ncbi:MAG: methyltransferase [Pseudomonadota bacterium]